VFRPGSIWPSALHVGFGKRTRDNATVRTARFIAALCVAVVVISNIFEQARQTPGKIAAVYNGVACNYSNFARLIEVSRRYFAQQDLPADSVAVIDVDNLLEAWILGLALRSLGLTTCATKDADEIAKLGLRCIGCVVTAEAENRPGAGYPVTPWRIVRVPASLRLSALQGPDPALPATMAHPGGHIMMTSGTTGAHKKVIRDAAMEALAIPLHAEINGISAQSVVYVANFGLWTAGGYRWPLITWSMGGTVVFHQEIDLHSPLGRHDMTHIFTTPATLAALLAASKGTLRRNDATRLLVTGGVLSQSMLATAKQLLTRRVYAVLASTEALTLAVTPLDQPDDLHWHRIHPSREVQVVDEAGTVLGPRREGFVRVRIIDGLGGYLDDEVATRDFFHDGYFYPGDLGMFGDDGRLSLRGRASDVINVLGDKIATDPIERALQDRLVAEGVCIVSIQNTEGEDEIYLVIQCGRPLERAELEAARRSVKGVAGPLPVRVAVVEKLPRNEMGKIMRIELKRQLLRARKASP
jgi:acyl-CoA synthetase (AMP-forming)/AMP-acid ligase II